MLSSRASFVTASCRMAFNKSSGLSCINPQAVLEENDLDTFLVALRDIVQANGGIAKTAQQKELGSESLFKTLSLDGNLQFSTLQAVLKSVGLQFSITADSGAIPPC